MLRSTSLQAGCFLCSYNFRVRSGDQPITVAARSKTWNVFARSNAGILGSNPIQGMDVCMRLFCVYVVLCVGNCLETGWSPVQGVLQIGLRNWKSGQGPTKGLESHRQIKIRMVTWKFKVNCDVISVTCCWNRKKLFNLFLLLDVSPLNIPEKYNKYKLKLLQLHSWTSKRVEIWIIFKCLCCGVLIWTSNCDCAFQIASLPC
jgi:hypothetical protein